LILIGVHGLQLLCSGRDGLGGYASSLDEHAPLRQRRPSYASKSGGDQLPADLDLDRDFTAVIRRGAFAVLFARGLARS
jgi:hypothetical protein